MNSNCASEFQQYNYPSLDCNQVDGRTLYYSYPTTDIPYLMPNGDIISFACNTMQVPDDGWFPNSLQNPGFEERNSSDPNLASYWNIISGTYELINFSEFNTTVIEMINDGTLDIRIGQFVAIDRQQPVPIRFSGVSAVSVILTSHKTCFNSLILFFF